MNRSRFSWVLSAAVMAAACTSPPPPPDASSDGGMDAAPSDASMDVLVCGAGEQRCGALCVDVNTNNDHCGGCGQACAVGQRCAMGVCGAAMMCPDGQTDCGGTCVDTKTSSAHCGECGRPCPASQSCVASACVVAVCAANETRCGASCVNTQSDVSNCGSCGAACAMGQMCAAGACVASTVMCTGTQTNCSGTCVELQTNRDNCGVCGRTCAPGQTCVAAVCTGAIMCGAGQTLCGSTCADVQVDPTHCGTCNHGCAASEQCVAGACVPARPVCSAGQTDCAPTAPTPTCVDLQTSALNCGACGTSCGAGQSCVAGRCVCSGSQTLCDRACVDTQTSSSHCGACNNVCAGGTTCQSGACRCASGEGLCGSPAICVNLRSDPANCGACGTACGGGSTCRSGACTCPAGQTGCGTPLTCVDTQSDRLNCGSCGRLCLLGQSCVNGACGCPVGQTMCGSGLRSRCANLQTDSSNCGACGTVCPSGASCVAGACTGVPPANDTRAGATVITLSGPRLVLDADTTRARHDVDGPSGCACTVGNDVFYRFTLAQSEIVMASTIGSSWDTSLFFLDSTGAAITAPSGFTTCNDDVRECGYTGTGSLVVSKLAAGTYYLALSGCSAGAVSIEFQHLPSGSGAPVRIAPDSSTRSLAATVSGTGTFASSCCSPGPETAHWWLTCPGTPTTSFNSATCSPANGINTAMYDVSLTQSSALRSPLSVCNDDVGFVCGSGSNINATIPATAANQVALNTLVVDSCTSSGGSATVFYTLANCATGTRCASACVDVATDSNHCGGCNRRCASGMRCVASACVPVAANDERASATSINMAQPQSTFSVNTTTATSNAVGSCGCTTGRDVFYRFTLTRPEMVYADTIGSTFDTSLFFQDSSGANVTTAGLTNGRVCNDDGGLSGCSTSSQSQVLVRLNAGTYYLVLSGCGYGSAVVHFQHIPIGNGPLRSLAAGSSVVSAATSGTGTINSACCSGGPEDTYYWYTCGSFAGGTMTASTCGRATWDTELAQVSAARTTSTVCNDDACGTQSSISAAIPAGAGLHALYVDGCGVGAGPYSIAVSRP